MRDVIFISLENWDGIWRRNQFLCAEWLRRFPGMRMLFVGRSRDVSHAVRTANWKSIREPSLSYERDFPGLTLLNPLKLLPNSIATCRDLNTRFLGAQVRAAARKAGMRSPLLWINDHFAAPLVGTLRERAVVYDITDDWTLMPAIGERERRLVSAADAKLCADANLVVVCSEALERSRRSLSRRIVKVPNGVDASHYRSCHAPQERQSLSGPVFGYVGTLHGDRLDIELLGALAQAYPEGRIVLCGPDFLTATQRESLKRHSNIFIGEPVHYSSVPGVMSSFDVCVLPHRCSTFTESLNPIKLWEYLASGKPVAATPVAGFREMAHLCHLGTGKEGFVAACTAALKEDGSRAVARIREAEANSWKARSEQLLEVFRQQGWLGRPVPKPRRASPPPHTQGELWQQAEGWTQNGEVDKWAQKTHICKTTQ